MAFAHRVTHVQVTVGGDHEYRPHAVGAEFLAIDDVLRNQHHVFLHQCTHVFGIGVAHQQVGDLVVQQRVLTAAQGRTHTVQQQRMVLQVEAVVIAVGMPVDRLVRIGDIGCVQGVVLYRQRGHRICLRTTVVIEVFEPEATTATARNIRPLGLSQGTDVDRHIGLAATRHQGIVFRIGQFARIIDLDHQLIERARR